MRGEGIEDDWLVWREEVERLVGVWWSRWKSWSVCGKRRRRRKRRELKRVWIGFERAIELPRSMRGCSARALREEARTCEVDETSVELLLGVLNLSLLIS